jgi:ABC-type glycerol-3-phosphate transport system substrate-binding protein
MTQTPETFGVSRRHFLQVTGFAAASVALLAACSPTPAATRLSGRIVISTAYPIPKSAQNALIAAYKKRQPDVQVVFELPGSDDYVSWLQTQLAAGDIRPDIVTGYVPYKNYVDFAAWSQRKNPYTGHAWSSDLTLKGNTDSSGKLMLLGTRSLTVPIIYNKDLFAKAGVSAPPTTWDELAAAAAKIAAIGVTPFAANFPLHVGQWMKEVYFDQYHAAWVDKTRAQKGDWNYDPAKDGTFAFDAQDPQLHEKYTFSPQRYYAGIRDGSLRFDTPEVEDLIANTAKVFPRYAPADFALPGDVYPSFLAQKGAMMANTPGALVSLQKDMKKNGSSFDFAYFPFPDMTGSLVQTTRTRAVESITGDYISVIGKSQKQTAVVMDFVEFWLSSAGYQTYLDGAVTDSSWSGPDGPLLIKDVKDPAPYTHAFDHLPSRGNAEASYNILFLNWGNGQGNFRTESGQIYLDALKGSITPHDAAAQIQSYVTSNLDGILKVSQLTSADLDNPARQPGS